MTIDRSRLVKEWLKAAEPTAALIGCTPAAIVAQACLETGWGAKAIGNNIFGIKAHGWSGKTQVVWTREVINGQSVMIQDSFRDYDSIEESFRDHFDFLMRNSRYKDVFDPHNLKSDEEYFAALQAAGYATDPHYAESLTAVKRAVLRYAGVPDAPLPWRNLAEGDRGEDVRRVQHALNERQHTPLVEDGIFGQLTERAVEYFQANNGLRVDGVVGPRTRAALGLE